MKRARQAGRGSGHHPGRGRAGERRGGLRDLDSGEQDGGAADRARGTPRPLPVATHGRLLVVRRRQSSQRYRGPARARSMSRRSASPSCCGACVPPVCRGGRSCRPATAARSRPWPRTPIRPPRPSRRPSPARPGVPREEVQAQAYRLAGAEASRHIFAVAASLDSQVIGEPQVLGQVKEAHRLAQCRRADRRPSSTSAAAGGLCRGQARAQRDRPRASSRSPSLPWRSGCARSSMATCPGARRC